MSGYASIIKQPGGRREVPGRRPHHRTTYYKMKSGEQILLELQKLLNKQGLKLKVIEYDDCWKVLWR